MATKMSMSRGGEDSIVGFNKKVANYTSYDSEDDYSGEEDFYDHYEPYEEEFDNGDYQPFNAEDEEKEYKARISPSFIKVVKPIFLNSPTKSAEKPPIKSPTWWDKNKPIEESKRMINGVLNYALLLPPPTPKPVVVPQQVKKSKKNKKGKDTTTKQPTEKKVKNNDSTVPSKPLQKSHTSKTLMRLQKSKNPLDSVYQSSKKQNVSIKLNVDLLMIMRTLKNATLEKNVKK
jgi:hypothetical protein